MTPALPRLRRRPGPRRRGKASLPAQPRNLTVEGGGDAGTLLGAEIVVAGEAVAGPLEPFGPLGRRRVAAAAQDDAGPLIVGAFFDLGPFRRGAIGDDDL